MELSDDAEKILQYYRARDRGTPPPGMEEIARVCPEILKHYFELRTSVLEGGTFPRKHKELFVSIAMLGNHHNNGFRSHIRVAIDHGLTKEELVEAVAIIIATLGFQAPSVAFRELKGVEIASNVGALREQSPLKDNDEDPLEYFRMQDGTVSPAIEALHRYRPETLKHYKRMLEAATMEGVLSRKLRELVMISAMLGSKRVEDVGRHVAAAVKNGLTKEEYIEFLAVLIPILGFQGFTDGIKHLSIIEQLT